MWNFREWIAIFIIVVWVINGWNMRVSAVSPYSLYYIISTVNDSYSFRDDVRKKKQSRSSGLLNTISTRRVHEKHIISRIHMCVCVWVYTGFVYYWRTHFAYTAHITFDLFGWHVVFICVTFPKINNMVRTKKCLTRNRNAD